MKSTKVDFIDCIAESWSTGERGRWGYGKDIYQRKKSVGYQE